MPHRPSQASSRLVFASLVLAMALAGCIPPGASQESRFPYRSGATYAVPAGEVLYVDARLTLDNVGLDVADVEARSLNWIPMGIRGESASALGWISITPPEAPADWQVRLWTIRVVRERPLGNPDGPASYRVEASLRVDVPESAYDLTRRVSTSLVSREGGRFPLTFLVEAR